MDSSDTSDKYKAEMTNLESTALDGRENSVPLDVQVKVEPSDIVIHELGVEPTQVQAMNNLAKKGRKSVKPAKTRRRKIDKELEILNSAAVDAEGHYLCPLCDNSDITFVKKCALKSHLLHIHREGTKKQFHPNTPLSKTESETNGDFFSSGLDEVPDFSSLTRNEDSKFPCPKCDQIYTLKPSLKRHYKHVHLNMWKSLKCEQCTKVFHSQLDLDRHILTHTAADMYLDEKPFKCSECESAFAHPSTLNKHKKHDHGEKPLKCPQCARAFAHPSTLSKHKKYVHGVKRTELFKCDMCDKEFSRKRGRDDHMRMHTGEKPYECEHCGKRFARRPEYTVHLASHSGTRIPCPYCQKTFTHNRYLNLHIRGQHETDNNHQCEHCHKRFLYKYKLVSHACTVSTATPPPRPHLCDICGRTYICRGDLMIHKRRHKGEKRHACELCGQRFTESFNLKKHLLRHNRETPTCSFCQKTFLSVKRLVKHEKRMHGKDDGHVTQNVLGQTGNLVKSSDQGSEPRIKAMSQESSQEIVMTQTAKHLNQEAFNNLGSYLPVPEVGDNRVFLNYPVSVTGHKSGSLITQVAGQCEPGEIRLNSLDNFILESNNQCSMSPKTAANDTPNICQNLRTNHIQVSSQLGNSNNYPVFPEFITHQ